MVRKYCGFTLGSYEPKRDLCSIVLFSSVCAKYLTLVITVGVCSAYCNAYIQFWADNSEVLESQDPAGMQAALAGVDGFHGAEDPQFCSGLPFTLCVIPEFSQFQAFMTYISIC